MELKYSARSYHTIIDKVQKHGKPVTVDGKDTVELLYPTLKVNNPIDRIVPHPTRKMNLAFAIVEFTSLMTGDYDIGLFTQFIRGYDRFSTDKKHLDGAYAERLHQKGDSINQCINMMKANPETRRAVAPIFAPGDTFGEGLTNTPCTLSLHFMSRKGILDCIGTMRSNDVYLGLPNDMFVFTMVQEFVAVQCGFKLGKYIHHPHSLHIYKSDIPKLEKVGYYWWPRHMTPMPSGFNYEQIYKLHDVIKHWLTNEEAFWYMVTQDGWLQYTRDLALACRAIKIRKADPIEAVKCCKMIEDSMIRLVVRTWMPGEKVEGEAA